MPADTVIRTEGISKQYRLGVIGRTALHEDLSRWWARLQGKPDPTLKLDALQRGEDQQDLDHVWALQDVNFEVNRGEVMGIIGGNGSGKSTLLKLLSRVTAPTTGSIKLKGRIASLLEVGTGFHPELTGRENIFLNGAILGMSRAEVQRNLDDIIDFSGIGKYIDTPVKRYSSGMYVRLAFSVAAHLEADTLLVDEVLAVGDVAFQAQCLGKMSDVARQGRTVLFVSHNLASVQNLCQSAIWLNRGVVASEKDTVSRVVTAYEESNRMTSGVIEVPAGDHKTVSPFQIQKIEIIGQGHQRTPVLKLGEPIRLRLHCSCSESLSGVATGIAIRSNGVPVATLLSEEDSFEARDKLHVLDCVIPGGELLPGMFEFDVGSARSPGNEGLDFIKNAGSFSVSDIGLDAHWTHNRRQSGIFALSNEWSRVEGDVS